MKKEQEKKTQERHLPERKVYPFEAGRELFSSSLSSSRLLEGSRTILETDIPIAKVLIPTILEYLKPIQIQISVFVDPGEQAQFAKQLEDKEKKTKETTEFQTPQEALRLASLVSDNSITEQAGILKQYCQQARRMVKVRSVSVDRNPNIIEAALQAFSVIAQGKQEFENKEEFFLHNTAIPAGTRLYAINLIMVLFRGNHFQGLRHVEIPSSYREIFEEPEEVLAFETFIQCVELHNGCLSSMWYTFHVTKEVVDLLSSHFYRTFTIVSKTSGGEARFYKGDKETPKQLTKMLPLFSIYPSQQCSRGSGYEVTLDAQDYTQMDTIRLKETLTKIVGPFDRFRSWSNTLFYGESVSKAQIEAHRQLDVIISSIFPSNSQSKIQELSQCIAGLEKNDKLMSIKIFKQMLEQIQTEIDPYLSLYLKESTYFTTNSTVPSLRA